jgi:hypothetical protein
MPYQTTWRKQGVIWTYSGLLTGDELLNSNFEIFGDERFDDIRYQIVDLREVQEIEVTEKHMRKVAHLDMAASRSNPRVKVAVLTNKPGGKLLSEIYDKYSKDKSPWETMLFTNIEDVWDWLQIQASEQ